MTAIKPAGCMNTFVNYFCKCCQSEKPETAPLLTPDHDATQTDQNLPPNQLHIQAAAIATTTSHEPPAPFHDTSPSSPTSTPPENRAPTPVNHTEEIHATSPSLSPPPILPAQSTPSPSSTPSSHTPTGPENGASTPVSHTEKIHDGTTHLSPSSSQIPQESSSPSTTILSLLRAPEHPENGDETSRNPTENSPSSLSPPTPHNSTPQRQTPSQQNPSPALSNTSETSFLSCVSYSTTRTNQTPFNVDEHAEPYVSPPKREDSDTESDD